jgi:hypothetical protein
VLSAAHARSQARAARDWPEADRLRAEIEAAGWTVVDRGTDFALRPASAPDTVEGDRTRYGASRNVPSRLAEPSKGLATVILVATDHPVALERTIAGLRAGSPAGVSIVVVADDPSDAQATALDAVDPDGLEVVWTSSRLGPAAAFDIGLRRASGPVVVRLDPGVEPQGDIVTQLIAALDDPSVAIAGGWGRHTTDLRAFTPAPVGDVDVVDGIAQAFRRADYETHGPIDARLGTDRYIDAWWSLALRDALDDDAEPRRAVRVDLPAVAAANDGPVADDLADPRQTKRDFYRVIGRFGGRHDLLRGPA